MYTYELVITSLLKKSTRNYRRSLKLLEHMEQKTSSQMQPNTAIYNAIISTSIKIKDVSTAMSVFQNMKAKPDIITSNSLMSVVATTGQWKFALKLLDDVNRAPGITPGKILRIYIYTHVCVLGIQMWMCADISCLFQHVYFVNKKK